MNARVYALILNWNGRPYLRECLDSLYGQDYDNLKVIFVDNGSTDGSVPYVRECFPQTEIMAFEKNEGYEVPNNRAIKRALSGGADYIFLLNNDLVFDPACVSALVNKGERDEHIGALCPVQLKYNDPATVISAGGDFDWMRAIVLHHKEKPQVDQEVGFISGAAFMVKRKVMETVGLLDEDYYFYGEDVDLSIRIRRHGYKLVCVASATVRHHVEGSSKDTAFRIYHLNRTRLILMHKHASFINRLYFMLFFVKNTLLGDWLSLFCRGRRVDAKAIIHAIRDSTGHHIRSEYAEPHA
jgi:GT2 family glycosyltransferase